MSIDDDLDPVMIDEFLEKEREKEKDSGIPLYIDQHLPYWPEQKKEENLPEDEEDRNDQSDNAVIINMNE